MESFTDRNSSNMSEFVSGAVKLSQKHNFIYLFLEKKSLDLLQFLITPYHTCTQVQLLLLRYLFRTSSFNVGKQNIAK